MKILILELLVFTFESFGFDFEDQKWIHMLPFEYVQKMIALKNSEDFFSRGGEPSAVGGRYCHPDDSTVESTNNKHRTFTAKRQMILSVTLNQTRKSPKNELD